MSLHGDLLTLARDLVNRNAAARVEAELRRAVSTAYYALFHLLVHESTTRLIAIANLRGRVGRAFEHGVMRTVCREYANPNFAPQGWPVPLKLRSIADEFGILQDARHQADYNIAIVMDHVQADIEVTRAETAFLDWAVIQADPATDAFLAELLCRSIRGR